MIKEIDQSQLEQCVQLIQKAFATVANDFNLTPENCPTHPSFIQLKHLNQMVDKGVSMFGYFIDEKIAGFIAIEQPNSIEPFWYIEKVSVLPEFRHQKIGEQLVKYALNEIKNRKGTYVSIALIDEQSALKNWYKKLGFEAFSTKTFTHLPFNVCFMERKFLQLEKTSGISEELKQLINELDSDLRERYGDAQIHGVDLQKADKSGIIFFVGHYGKEAICCGAIRPFNKTQVELKRMFVRKEFRGKGLSKQLYLRLEEEAKQQEFSEIILETGMKQFEAQSLYKSMGFAPIDKYGEYVNDQNSLCFAKKTK